MNGFKVLVVDDEPFICRALSFLLRRDDFEVIEARDGMQALEKIEDEKPDLVLLDVMMPKLNGFEVVERVRANPDTQDIKIVLLTARGQAADRERGALVGADDYITKPFSPTKILERTRDLLGVG